MTLKCGIMVAVLAIVCLVQYANSLASYYAATTDADRVGEGKYIVVLKKEEDTDIDATSFVTREFLSKSEYELNSTSYQIEHMYDHAISGFSATLSEDIREQMRNLPEVKYIEEVVQCFIQCKQDPPPPPPPPKPKTTTPLPTTKPKTTTPLPTTKPKTTTPLPTTKPKTTTQPPTTTPKTTTPQSTIKPKTKKPPTTPPQSWGLDRIDQRDLPLDNGILSYQENGGPGVHIYIIDTGVSRTHKEFNGRFSDDGFDAYNERVGIDCNGHGTHVAGTAAGATYGVASKATIHSVRVLDCDGNGRSDVILRGMNWVAENAVLPAVASISIGFPFVVNSFDEAVENLFQMGIVVSVAAGNSDTNACNTSPASAPNAISVGATDIRDKRASFSNYGACLDIFAPGVNITSAWIGADDATNSIPGTSMACPHVSGVAAILLGRNPTLTPTQLTNTLLALSTINHVSDPEEGSENRLLYIGKDFLD